MVKIDEKIYEITEKVVRDQGVDLLDVIVTISGNNSRVKFIVDRPGGVTLDECTLLNRKISDIFDMYEDEIRVSSYTLEVTSPGEDYPLTTVRDLKRKIGKKVQVKYYEGDNIQEITGNIIKVNDDDLELDQGGKIFSVSMSKLIEGKLKYDI